MTQALRHGSDENAYQLVAFPLEIREAGAALLEDKLGAYDATMWRFFRWNPVDLLFNEYPAVGDLRHGLAFWLITVKPDIRLETGAAMTVSTVKPYTVVLQQGWNDIGIPFTFPIDWDDVIAASAIDTQKVQGPHGYDGRWVYPFENKVLQPWIGYSIYSDVDDISVVIPALEAQPSLAKSRPFAGKDIEWACEIRAQSHDMVDEANYFGCAKSATDEWDYGLDFVEAPGIGSYISLYFEHEKWALRESRFTTDFRPPKKGHVWEFQLAANKTEHDVRLSFRPLAPLPKSLELRLVDEEAAVNIDLGSDSTYTFRFARNHDVRHFKIYAGDPDFMQSQEEALAELPKQTEPVRNFPNPFNSSTVISYELSKDTEVELAVYNLLAQKVRQLRSGFQEKGFYQVIWDAHDDTGRQLGTGVYILRLETPDLTFTCKMVYMR
ncbi:T9SS type A sorting domain-containing protein, partial [candidate division KSB1 bacterium]|nr:T9SS type A sorting domain-containing protein [candidate division KSB1 bacterium]RQW07921.1 MAG: T9SS C-terminal target domain-containing protein [candidate division KSB1 bacterium]